MTIALKVFGVLFGLLALGLGGFATFIHLDWPMRHQVESHVLHVELTPERLARGRNLVGMRCAGCHYDQKTGGLTGQAMADLPKEFGEFFSRNITKHPTKGAGRYTDGELAYLLRTGVTRDGRFTGPLMQSPYLADEDLHAIIAFLRSDDPWVAAKDTDDRESKPSFLGKLLWHLVFNVRPMPPAPIEVPPLADEVAYGRYVVHALADCFVCHSADMKTLNPDDPTKSEDYLGGGNPMLDAAGNVIRGANITMDRETGIGAWSEAEFLKTVRTGFRPDGKPLRFPMMPYPELSDAELRATFAYLNTVPPIRKTVERSAGTVASASEGQRLYNTYGCYSCHGTEGVGVCDLREASKKYDSDEKLAAFIRDPSTFVPGTKMPTWQGVIADHEYPALLAHLRALEQRRATAP
jgi:mono/diheme cytochrome c family protein